ncbi:MAG: hypothetical protein R3D52_10810 [Xanthobacteraceae bacterium]
MRKILLAGGAALGLIGTASAADFALATTAPAPLFTWTGCYLGINGGWIGGGDKYRHAAYIGALPREIAFHGMDHGAPTYETLYNDYYYSDGFSHGTNASGETFGGQFGCQHQWGGLVLGGEWDANWSGLKENHHLSGYNPLLASHWNHARGEAGPVAEAYLGNGVTERYQYGYSGQTQVWAHMQLNWFSTSRVRVGWAAWNRFLIYATGGLAIGGFDAYTTINSGGQINYINSQYVGLGLAPDFYGAYRKVRVGYTVGGGFEWAFANNWTAKAEFLYLDFGSDEFRSNYVSNIPNAAACTSYTNCTPYHTTSIDFQQFVVRVGLNYFFQLGPAPALARH